MSDIDHRDYETPVEWVDPIAQRLGGSSRAAEGNDSAARECCAGRCEDVAPANRGGCYVAHGCAVRREARLYVWVDAPKRWA